MVGPYPQPRRDDIIKPKVQRNNVEQSPERWSDHITSPRRDDIIKPKVQRNDVERSQI